jgi:hypothetical protein
MLWLQINEEDEVISTPTAAIDVSWYAIALLSERKFMNINGFGLYFDLIECLYKLRPYVRK